MEAGAGWGLGGGGGWRAEQDHHCIAGHHEWPIVHQLAVSASLCLDCEKEGETEQNKTWNRERAMERFVVLMKEREMKEPKK